MKSPVVKRSIVVAGHKTSVSLEEAFWSGMKEISVLRDMTLSQLVGVIDTNRQQGNLSSAIRLFVLDYFRSAEQAEVNRVKFGRTKAERTLDQQRANSAKDLQDQHLIDSEDAP
jgi:predicted DNA-binding ribbon-helix-helix protein